MNTEEVEGTDYHQGLQGGDHHLVDVKLNSYYEVLSHMGWGNVVKDTILSTGCEEWADWRLILIHSLSPEEAVVVVLLEDVAPVEDRLGCEQAGDEPYVVKVL